RRLFPAMSLLPVESAIAAILRRVPAPTLETVPLAAAAGRVLLTPLIATHDQPPFNASAMDGYALRAADVVDGHALAIIGTSQAGAGFSRTVGPGQAVRIFTGAPVPPGADTVIMQEEAIAEAGTVRFTAPARLGHSIRPRGNDFASGQQLLDPGMRLAPMHLAVAAAANAAALGVAKRPTISLLATGDELVLPGAPLQPDQIVASNSFGLAPLLAPYAESVTDHGIAQDNHQKLTSMLAEILDNPP